jgi:hypothetical protein
VAGVAARACALAFVGVLLSACGGDGVDVDEFHVAAADRAACQEFLDAAPEQLADQPRRDVNGSGYAAAWGDPAIVLRCGVPLPDDYATAPCVTRNGIGWSIPEDQTEGLGTDVEMTLAFRSLVVQVHLPERYRPNGPMNVMADLDSAVRKHTTGTGHCS